MKTRPFPQENVLSQCSTLVPGLRAPTSPYGLQTHPPHQLPSLSHSPTEKELPTPEVMGSNQNSEGLLWYLPG